MRPVRIALTKGRLEKKAVSLFETMGLDCSQLNAKGRRLVLPVGDFEVVLAKAADVITYVRHGVCDMGIVGKDTIAESGDGVIMHGAKLKLRKIIIGVHISMRMVLLISLQSIVLQIRLIIGLEQVLLIINLFLMQ